MAKKKVGVAKEKFRWSSQTVWLTVVEKKEYYPTLLLPPRRLKLYFHHALDVSNSNMELIL